MAGKRQIELVLSVVDKASAKLNGIGKSANNLGKGLSSVGQAGMGMAKMFMKAGGIAVAALAGIGLTMNKLAKDSAKGLEFQAFFTKTFGKNVEKSLGVLRKAAKGTVADIDLMAISNRASMLGVTDSVSDLEKMMKFARLSGKAMGVDTKQAFDNLVTGIGRGSPLILDNLGILIPDAFKEATKEMTEAERKQALLNYALEEGSKLSKELGGDVLTAADKFAILSANVANTKQKIGEALLPIVLKLHDAMTNLARGIKEGFIEKMPEIRESLDSLRNTFSNLFEATGLANISIEEIGITIGEKLGEWVNIGIGFIDDFYNAVEEKLPEIKTALGGLKEALGFLKEETEEEKKATDDLMTGFSTALDPTSTYKSELYKLVEEHDNVSEAASGTTDETDTFGGKLGGIAAGNLIDIIEGLKTLFGWFEDNKEEIGDLIGSLGDLAGEFIIFFADLDKLISRIDTITDFIFPLKGIVSLIEKIQQKAGPTSEQLSNWQDIQSGNYQNKAAGGIIEKFATGGIRGRDNIPAMLSEGEMVLNKGQQKNLFNMVNEGKGGGVSINIEGDVVVDSESRMDEWVNKIELALGNNANLDLRGA